MDENATPPPVPVTRHPPTLAPGVCFVMLPHCSDCFSISSGHLLGPLVVWLAKRADSPEIDAHGKESLNFQLSMLIYDAIAVILCFVFVGIPILVVLWIMNTVLVIVASIQASEGKLYRYPFAIRLIN